MGFSRNMEKPNHNLARTHPQRNHSEQCHKKPGKLRSVLFGPALAASRYSLNRQYRFHDIHNPGMVVDSFLLYFFVSYFRQGLYKDGHQYGQDFKIDHLSGIDIQKQASTCRKFIVPVINMSCIGICGSKSKMRLMAPDPASPPRRPPYDAAAAKNSEMRH